MNITEQAAKVLAEIDEQLAICEKEPDCTSINGFEYQDGYRKAVMDCRASYTVCPKSLRCLKTAIEGLLEIYKYDAGNGCCTYGCDTPTIAENLLTTLITQWNENK